MQTVKTNLIQLKQQFFLSRNDWNLLSTATPAINAWMNPCHRAILSANILYSNLNKRICSVMASIMTDALEKDYQGLHLMTKVMKTIVYF